MSVATACWRCFAQRKTPRRMLLSLSPLLALLTVCYFVLGNSLPAWQAYGSLQSDSRAGGSTAPSSTPWSSSVASSPVYSPGQDEDTRNSPYSFDVAEAHHPTWMAMAPDSWSLARLALLGTHDSLTHRIRSPIYRCQNGGLAVHLRAGVRYLDVRTRVQVPPSASAVTLLEDDSEPWPLGVYHGSMYTGYEFSKVMSTVFRFLDDYPSETIVVRLKEEGPPVYGTPSDAPGLGKPPKRERADGEAGAVADNRPWWERVGSPAQLLPSPYEASFRRYRLQDPSMVDGFAEHLYRFPNQRGDSGAETAPTRVPTMGELRGKVLLLQEFPYYPGSWAADELRLNMSSYFGIPWSLSSELLQVEDLYEIDDVAHLDEKWAAVKKSLQAAAKSAREAREAREAKEAKEAKLHKEMLPLFLTHLSASVGVTPIDAAAGPANGSVAGINDRTGTWLETSSGSQGAAGRTDWDPVGIVVADFPGRQLMDALLRRNNFP